MIYLIWMNASALKSCRCVIWHSLCFVQRPWCNLLQPVLERSATQDSTSRALRARWLKFARCGGHRLRTQSWHFSSRFQRARAFSAGRKVCRGHGRFDARVWLAHSGATERALFFSAGAQPNQLDSSPRFQPCGQRRNRLAKAPRATLGAPHHRITTAVGQHSAVGLAGSRERRPSWFRPK